MFIKQLQLTKILVHDGAQEFFPNLFEGFIEMIIFAQLHHLSEKGKDHSVKFQTQIRLIHKLDKVTNQNQIQTICVIRAKVAHDEQPRKDKFPNTGNHSFQKIITDRIRDTARMP